MTWARLDDGYYDHPKILEAWEINPASIGLHARAISYVAKHELDGRLSPQALAALMPSQPDREKAIAALTEAGLLEPNGSGFVLHDYLDLNPSRNDLTKKRQRDRDRKRGA